MSDIGEEEDWGMRGRLGDAALKAAMSLKLFAVAWKRMLEIAGIKRYY